MRKFIVWAALGVGAALFLYGSVQVLYFIEYVQGINQ